MKNKGIIWIIAIIAIIIIFGTILIVMQSKTKEENKQIADNNKNNENTVIGDTIIDDTDEIEEKVEEYVEILDNGTKLNKSDKLNSEKNVQGLKISNTQLTTQDGRTVLLADVTNNTGKDIDVTLIDITLKDAEGKEIVTVGGILSPMKAGETIQLTNGMTLDYANAYDFEIKIK